MRQSIEREGKGSSKGIGKSSDEMKNAIARKDKL